MAQADFILCRTIISFANMAFCLESGVAAERGETLALTFSKEGTEFSDASESTAAPSEDLDTPRLLPDEEHEELVGEWSLAVAPSLRHDASEEEVLTHEELQRDTAMAPSAVDFVCSTSRLTEVSGFARRLAA